MVFHWEHEWEPQTEGLTTSFYKQSYFTFKFILDGFWVQVNWFPKSMLNKILLNSFSTTPLSKMDNQACLVLLP